MSFHLGADSCGTRDPCISWDCTVVPLNEYNEMIGVLAAIQTVNGIAYRQPYINSGLLSFYLLTICQNAFTTTTLCLKKNVPLFTFAITSSDVGRFS